MTQLSRSRWAAIGAAVAVTLGGGGLIGVSAAGTASSFVSVDPVRVLDTRQGTAGKVDDATIELQVTGAVTTYTSSGTPTATVVPSGATSVSVNLTVTEGVRNGDYGFVTAFPCASKSDAVPNASSLNFVERVDVANGLTVPLSSGGKMCLNVYGEAHLIVDVSGYFTTASAGAVGAYTKAETDALVAPLELAQFRGPVETPVTVDAAGEVGEYNSVAIGANGLPVIAYYDFAAGDLRVAECNDLGCTGDDETISTVDATGNTGLYPSIAIGRDGNPVIAYHDFTNLDLKVAVCNDPACSGGDETIRTVDSTGSVGVLPSLAIGLNGFPIMSYYDQTNLSLKIAACAEATCAGAATISTLDTSVSSASALTIAPSGYAWVANGKSGTLRLHSCLNATCSNSSPATVEAAGGADFGYRPSITVGVDGYAVITHYDNANDRLRVVKCITASCSSGAIGTGFGSAGQNLGLRSSVRIGPSGLPVIAYRDENAGAIFLLNCQTRSCDTSVHADAYEIGGGNDPSMAIAPNGYPVISYYSGPGTKDLKMFVPWWVEGGR